MRKNKIKYYTAVAKAKTEEEHFEGVYRKDRLTAFEHNIFNGIHEEFKNADVIYTEIFWEQGFIKFFENSTVETYHKFLDCMVEIIKGLNVPAYIVVGKNALNYLKPEKTLTIKYNQHGDYPCTLAIYNADKEISGEDEVEIRKSLADEYDTVLDFCCGYGNTAETFLSKGKEAIISDINGHCIKTAITELERIEGLE